MWPSFFQEMLWVDPCSFITQFDDISPNHSILFHFGHVYVWTIQAMLEWVQCICTYAMGLKPFFHFNISTTSSASCLHDINTSLIFSLGAPKSIGQSSLIGTVAQSLQGQRSSPSGLYHRALMLFFLSCEQSLTLKVSLNLYSSMPYDTKRK